MDHVNPNQPEPLVIRGDFSPADGPVAMGRLIVLLAAGLVLAGVLAFGLYALKVYLSSDLAHVGTDTREMNEQNKELQVSLNRIRSFKNVEDSVRRHAQISELREAEEIIEVSAADIPNAPAAVPRRNIRRYANAHGY